MSSSNAPANAHHGSSSFRQLASLAFSSPLSAVDYTNEPSSSPIRALPPLKDCRWNRRPHGDLSTRAFSTKQLESILKEGSALAGLETHDVQQNAQSQQDLKTNLAQLRQHATEVVGMKSATHHDTPAVRSLCTSQHDQLAVTRLSHANSSNSSSESDRAANASESSLPDTLRDDSAVKVIDDFITGSEPKLSQSGDSTMDDASDIDFVSCSTDKNICQLDKNVSEGGESNNEADEKHAPLEFQIPDNILRAAMTAPANTKASFWSSSLYRGLEGKRIAIHYCKTKEVAERVAQHFVNEKVVGFDIEWKPWAAASSIKKNVSLIQLASEGRIALFHIALFAGTTAAQLMPRTLKAILESPAVYKVGVAVKGDFNRITKFLDIKPQGVFELSRLHNLVEWYATDSSKVTNKLVGLASQVQRHLQLPLYKGGHLIDDPEDLLNVRSSDWSLPLNVQQIHYAAADAYAGFRLYDVLEEKRKQLKPIPPRPLVCDYDSKSIPKYNKPKKKGKTTIQGDITTDIVLEKVVARAEHGRRIKEELGEEAELTQEMEGYETAQEQLTDSHELEGEEQDFLQERFEGTSESDDDRTIDSALSAKDQTALGTDAERRPKRVGRINPSLLSGYDPGYPTLPDHGGSEGTYASPNEDFVELSVFEEKDLSGSTNPIKEPKEDIDSNFDEFEDPELEELLKDLSIDIDGRIQENTNSATLSDSVITANQAVQVFDSSLGAKHMQLVEEPRMGASQYVKDGQGIHNTGYPNASQTQLMVNKSTAPAGCAGSNEEVQQFIDHPVDPEVTSYLSASTQPTTSSPPPSPMNTSTESAGLSNHTPEYDFATSWARTYLASTIPSPTLCTPSRIRATIPHLRAYNMWYHQELSLGEIARHLRDPPLSESTVGSYVLQAITLERMEYDANEVRKVLMSMPEALRKGKWRHIAEKVGAK